jgi:hypothetical protein
VALSAGCASTPTHWEDITGHGRGQPEFIMDRGRCQLVSQDASYREQLSVNQQNANGCAGTPAGCATLGALQGIGVGMAGSDAFSACMNAMGWNLVADTSVGTSLPTPDPCLQSAIVCVASPPPAPKVEVTGNPPQQGYIWFPGYYRWYPNTGYQWEGGLWHEPNPGHRWVPPHWTQQGSKWLFHPGSWT